MEIKVNEKHMFSYAAALCYRHNIRQDITQAFILELVNVEPSVFLDLDYEGRIQMLRDFEEWYLENESLMNGNK